jgi:hypothetical protein
MHRPLSLGFIGGGINSAIGLTHNIASQMDGHFQLTTGCFSRDTSLNQQTGRAWGLKTRLFTPAQSRYLKNNMRRWMLSSY